MIRKETKIPNTKNVSDGKANKEKTDRKVTVNSQKPAKVDRPGFDLGGSTGKTSAGTGVGLGPDAAENSKDRSLPGRRGKVQDFKDKAKQ